MRIVVVLADDHPLVLEAMRSLLAGAEDIVIQAVCVDGVELRRAVAEHPPDVVVTDIRMPPGHSDEGIRIAQELRRDHPQTGVVVVSSANVPQYAIDLLEGGSQGRAYLLKERLAQPGELVHAVREVAAGRAVIDPAVLDAMTVTPTIRATSPQHETPAAAAEPVRSPMAAR